MWDSSKRESAQDMPLPVVRRAGVQQAESTAAISALSSTCYLLCKVGPHPWLDEQTQRAASSAVKSIMQHQFFDGIRGRGRLHNVQCTLWSAALLHKLHLWGKRQDSSLSRLKTSKKNCADPALRSFASMACLGSLAAAVEPGCRRSHGRVLNSTEASHIC